MISDFLENHPIFTRENFIAYRQSIGASTGVYAIKSALAYYRRKKHIVCLRNNLFAARASLFTQQSPYLIAHYLSSDSVLAFEMAMSARHKKDAPPTCYYFSTRHVRAFNLDGRVYKSIMPPKALLIHHQTFAGTESFCVAGQAVRVATRERVLVDGLYQPALLGGWHGLWRYFHQSITLDWTAILRYIAYFDSPILYAKLGFFLSHLAASGVNVPESLLHELSEHLPKSVCYIDNIERFPYATQWRLISPWRLMVPDSLFNETI